MGYSGVDSSNVESIRALLTPSILFLGLLSLHYKGSSLLDPDFRLFFIIRHIWFLVWCNLFSFLSFIRSNLIRSIVDHKPSPWLRLW